MPCPTVKIKPSHPSQGAFVEINESDFDEAKGHERYIEPPPSFVPSPADLPPPPAPPADPLAGLAADWRDKPTEEVKAIAFAIDGRAVDNREQAIAVIEAALAAKAAQ